MKVKEKSFLIKIILVILGFTFCVLKWCGILPDAEVKEIWYAVGIAYAVSLGTVDFNICRDNWIEPKQEDAE